MKSLLKVISLNNNEKTLIQKAKKSNREAQHRLYDLYASKMLSVCRYYINDLQQAEDVMLSGFFKVFTHLKNFRGDGSFEGWIRKIMVREAISFLRQQKKMEVSLEDQVVKDVAQNTTTLEVADIQDAIDTLPEGYRTVFVLYAIEGYKHHEIAKLLDISEGTSKSQLFKARKLLQGKLAAFDKRTSYGTK